MAYTAYIIFLLIFFTYTKQKKKEKNDYKKDAAFSIKIIKKGEKGERGQYRGKFHKGGNKFFINLHIPLLTKEKIFRLKWVYMLEDA